MGELTVVLVIISSVTTLRVSTTEMYPRRRAMARAVFPFYTVEDIISTMRLDNSIFFL